jgi:hypothetical protein
LASPPRSKRAILRDVSVRFAPLPPVWRDGRVRPKALALKARAPYGAADSDPHSLRHDVHVRQIRLAASVRKTATFRGFGGSNPLTCTKLCFVFFASGVEKWPISLALIRQVLARSNRAPRTATSSNDRTPPCRGVRCEFESRRSRHISPVYARLVWRMLFQGIDSRVRFPSPAPGL